MNSLDGARNVQPVEEETIIEAGREDDNHLEERYIGVQNVDI